MCDRPFPRPRPRLRPRPYLLEAVQVQRGHVPGYIGYIGHTPGSRRCQTYEGALARARRMAWEWGCRVEIWHGYEGIRCSRDRMRLLLVIKPKGA